MVLDAYHNKTPCHLSFRLSNRIKDMWLAFCAFYVVRNRKKRGWIFLKDLFCSEIINLLFVGFTYNTRGHFAHCSYFFPPCRSRNNTAQLAKCPRILYLLNHRIRCIFFRLFNSYLVLKLCGAFKFFLYSLHAGLNKPSNFTLLGSF